MEIVINLCFFQELEMDLDTSIDSIQDDETLDPDWHKTPDVRPRRRAMVSSRSIRHPGYFHDIRYRILTQYQQIPF